MPNPNRRRPTSAEMAAPGTVTRSSGISSNRQEETRSRCPECGLADRVSPVPTVYAAGTQTVDLRLSHHRAGRIVGKSSGRASSRTALAVALAPPAPRRSWMVPARITSVAAFFGFLIVAIASQPATSTSAETPESVSTIVLLVFAVAGTLTVVRWRRDRADLPAVRLAYGLWRQTFWCGRCGTPYLPRTGQIQHGTGSLGSKLLQTVHRQQRAQLHRG